MADSAPGTLAGSGLSAEEGDAQPGAVPGTAALPPEEVPSKGVAEQLRQAEADRELRPGTRINVSPHGEGSYSGFKQKRIGANEHTIIFDSSGRQVVRLKDLHWNIIEGDILQGLTKEAWQQRVDTLCRRFKDKDAVVAALNTHGGHVGKADQLLEAERKAADVPKAAEALAQVEQVRALVLLPANLTPHPLGVRSVRSNLRGGSAAAGQGGLDRWSPEGGL